MTLDPVEVYQRAAALFGETISTLADEEWELPARPVGADDGPGPDEPGSPDGWTVLSTVAWVVVGDAQITRAVDEGAVVEAPELSPSVLGPNAVATWRGTILAALTRLREPGALATVISHSEGDLHVVDLIGQRVTENLVRAWDVGRATGHAVTIPADLADWCLDFWAGHAEAVLTGGVLPDRPRVPEPDAGAADRLLALTGR